MAWDSESEERMAPGLLRAVWSVDESDREPMTRPGAVVVATGAEDWDDDYEGPVRGRLRRALLAVD